MSVTRFVDMVYPYTSEDNRCGHKRAAKTRLRFQLINNINDYKRGVKIELPEPIKNLIMPDDKIKKILDEFLPFPAHGNKLEMMNKRAKLKLAIEDYAAGIIKTKPLSLEVDFDEVVKRMEN